MVSNSYAIIMHSLQLIPFFIAVLLMNMALNDQMTLTMKAMTILCPVTSEYWPGGRVDGRILSKGLQK